MATFDTNKRTIGELLSMTNPPIIVPEWQRDYSWTTREIETFWLDLIAFMERYPDDNVRGREYFLGSVVLVLRPDAHLLSGLCVRGCRPNISFKADGFAAA